ncbi:MAG: hypothetical protein QW429_01510 [Thermoprotei archaeon]
MVQPVTTSSGRTVAESAYYKQGQVVGFNALGQGPPTVNVAGQLYKIGGGGGGQGVYGPYSGSFGSSTSSQTQTPAPTPAPTYGPVSGGFGVSSQYTPMPVGYSPAVSASAPSSGSSSGTVWKLALGLGPLALAWVFAKPIRRRRRGIVVRRRARRYRFPIRRRRVRARRLRR